MKIERRKVSALMQQGLDRIRWIIAGLAVLVVAVFGIAGCGKDPASIDGIVSGGGASSPEAQRQQYDQVLARVRDAVEDPNAPSFDQAIATGNRKQLMAAAIRWDDGTAILAAATPPDDVQAEHKKLLDAMTTLGDFNRQMAKAAPDVRRVKQLYRQAQASPASKQFGQAQQAIETKGYHVSSSPDDTPLDSASSPVG